LFKVSQNKTARCNCAEKSSLKQKRRWAIERATVAVNPVTLPVNAPKGEAGAEVADEADSEVDVDP